MADRVIKVLTPSDTYSLMTLEELKIFFGIPDTDTSQDEQLTLYIEQFSDAISTACNRVFAYEEVSEIWRCTEYDNTNMMKRLFLSHWPIDLEASITIESPTGSPLDPATYEIEERSGKIELLGGSSEPIKVSYSGGYRLPDDAPPALKQALVLMVREGQAMMNRLAVSGIRSVSHKESRVMYFDTQASMAKQAGQAGGGSFITGQVHSLLYHYMRLEV